MRATDTLAPYSAYKPTPQAANTYTTIIIHRYRRVNSIAIAAIILKPITETLPGRTDIADLKGVSSRMA